MVELDRLGRSIGVLFILVHELEEKGASLRVLEPTIDTGGPMGRMVLTVLGMVAEMDLASSVIQRAGIDAANAKGVYRGRYAARSVLWRMQTISEDVTTREPSTLPSRVL